MPFFNSAFEAFTTLAAIAAGAGFVIVWREVLHLRQVEDLKDQIGLLRETCVRQDIEINTLKDIMLKHWPSESVRLNVGGDVNNSNLSSAGRDVEGKLAT